ncbi:hypothetical protein B0H10DRAFT_2234784 [Mycena sp. CBHHK59/15]|nr:hypothetical protein B0H10DRAFT_2234784 [Mycena sp. CBHHK59/15]
MSMPGLKTRDKNKKTRPAILAGVAKDKDAEAKKIKAREDETTAKARAALQSRRKLKELVAIEDQQHRDDVEYSIHANHPVDKVPKEKTASEEPAAPVDDSGSGDDSDAYEQPSEDSKDSEESDNPNDGDNSNDEPSLPKKGKKAKASRADVQASRTTRDSTGTPAVEGESISKKRKAGEKPRAGKKKKSKMTASSSDQRKKSGLNQRGATAKDVSSGVDDDNMEEEEEGTSGYGKCLAPIDSDSLFFSLPLKTGLDIKPIELTGKAARGGDAKWQLKHLPEGTAAKFTDELVPLARELAGARILTSPLNKQPHTSKDTPPPARSPWDALTVKQIQGLVDKVYSAGKYTVKNRDVWVGLVGYRLSDWYSGLGAHAEKVVETMIESAAAESDDEEDSDKNDMPVDEGAPPAPTVRKFDFKTPEGIAEFIEWALEEHPGNMMAFHWTQWGEGVDKKGFLQQHLILYVFAYHLTSLDAIPQKYGRLMAPLIAALLLSVQAVQRALGFWSTGVFKKQPKHRPHYFSSDNWDDTTLASDRPGGRPGKLVRRATSLLASVEKWDAERWDVYINMATAFMEVPTRRRAASSHSASEAADDLMFSEDEPVIIVSD